MAARDAVRIAQRKLAALDATHARAVARLDQARTRRAVVVGEQDRLVGEAELEVAQAVSSMVNALGPELSAGLLGLDSAELRRVARSDARGGSAPATRR